MARGRSRRARSDRDELLRRARGPRRPTRRSLSIPAAARSELRLELARMGRLVSTQSCFTHTHWDHFVGLAELAEGTGAPVYAPEARAGRADGPVGVLRERAGAAPSLGARALAVGRGDDRRRGRSRSTSCTFPATRPAISPTTRTAACFPATCCSRDPIGRTDLPYADHDTLIGIDPRRSVERFPPETIVYSGHGPPTALGDEVATKPLPRDARSA